MGPNDGHEHPVHANYGLFHYRCRPVDPLPIGINGDNSRDEL
jgi:hypothetical protein